MIKVLIVDDEPKLREGMRTLIPWEEQGYTVVATAANGFEALEKFQTHAPKLILADIRMPGMDGLDLIAELRDRGADCHVLILSGHADFEYAKRAISYHVDGYLLKPVDEDELLNYLKELRETIEQEEFLSRLQAEGPVRNDETLLRDLLQPRENIEAAEDAAAILGLLDRSLEVVLVELKGLHKGEAYREEQVRGLLEQKVKPERGLLFSLPPYLGILLKQPLTSAEARTAFWQELNRIISGEGLDFRAATGGIALVPEEVAMSFDVAVERLEDAFFGPPDTLLSGTPDLWGEAEENIVQAEEADLETDGERDEEMQLLLTVETGNHEAVGGLIGRIIRKLVGEKREEAYLKENLIRIISSIVARLEAANPEVRAAIADVPSPMSELYGSDNLTGMQGRLTAYLEQISKRMGGGKGDEIKRITDLIQRRYNENLKLGALAEVFNYNSAYLGKMFKLQVGEHFNTYLDKVRIEKAKQFLNQGMKVYEVAEKVGYMNADYFNAKFRKYVGVSPTAFRKEK